MTSPFRLDPAFVATYATRTPPFGFNGLGELVYLRTYSRVKDDGTKEAWYETVERVINGCYTMQKRHIETHSLGWSDDAGQESAREMYDRMWHMKFLPPGRGLWAMGSPITEERGIYAALNNCAFVSTAGLSKDLAKPFCFLMDASCLGVGVGFDCKGADTLVIQRPLAEEDHYVVEDSREGWVEALRRLLNSYFIAGSKTQTFDYSHVRPAGLPIKGFGGVSSGSDPLRDMLEKVRTILTGSINKPISITTITDIMNLIGVCIVAGNVRRCLPGDALVHTKNGLVPIRDVKIGAEVLTDQGYNTVTDHVVQGVQELVKIVTQDGVFRCTPTHRMAVLQDVEGNYEWVTADKLQAGDRLMSTRVAIPGGKTSLPSSETVVVPELDTKMAWFIGVFRDAGYVHQSYISQVFRLDEMDIALGVQEQLQRFGSDLVVELEERDGKLTVRCESQPLSCYMAKHVKLGDTPLEAPCWILQSTVKVRQAYLAGVYDSCGRSTNPVQVVSTVHINWAREVQNLLYSCGIQSRLVTGDSCNLVQLTSTRSIEMFIDLVNYKVNRRFTDLDFYPVEIITVLPDTSEETYDISVKDNHCFYVNGYLSHNTAEIAFGAHDSEEFINLKNYEKNPQRMAYGWTSNNSIFADLGMDYSKITKQVIANGEPGIAWLNNMQEYSRMNGVADFKDRRVLGGNPCVSSDTMVLTDKGQVAVRDLVGKQFTAVVDGKLYPSTSRGFWKTASDQQLLRLQLDNGSFVRCTANHQILTKGENWVEAGNLKEGMEVMLSENANFSWDNEVGTEIEGYFLAKALTDDDKVPEDRSVQFTTGLIYGLLEDTRVDDNIGFISIKRGNKTQLEAIQRLLLSLGIACKIVENNRVVIRDDSLVRFCDRIHFQDGNEVISLCDDRFTRSKFFSKVLAITPDGREDVYDATIPGISRFTANGIIVHNCLEQSLESYELCCLVETFPYNADNREDYLRTLKFAYLYAKTVTLGKTHWADTNRVMLRNRRIGCSISGIAQFISKYSLEEFRVWCEEGYGVIQHYDEIYANWLCVPRSIKTTSIKPSGSVSLLAGATAGMHYPESRFYIRRMRLSDNSPLIAGLLAGGYHVEKDTYSANTMVVEVPIDSGEGVRTQREVSMWEQLALAAFLQRHWADNQVSCTVTFDPATEGSQIEHALNYYQYQLKGISFLPRLAAGAYAQMPYEAITEETYKEKVALLKKTVLTEIQDAVAERFCDGDTCTLR